MANLGTERLQVLLKVAGQGPLKLFFVSAPECRDTVLGARMYVRPQKHAQKQRG